MKPSADIAQRKNPMFLDGLPITERLALGTVFLPASHQNRICQAIGSSK
jgi:hypothetical protein